MKPQKNRRLFCVARPDLTNQIVQICSKTAGIDATEIEPIDPGKLRLFNPDCEEQLDASGDFGKWLTTSQASDPSAVVAVIIDASSESPEIARWLRDSPETVWAVGQHAFQQFQESHRIPGSLANVNSDSKSLRLLALAMLLSKSGFLCLLCLSRKAAADQTKLPIKKCPCRGGQYQVAGIPICTRREPGVGPQNRHLLRKLAPVHRWQGVLHTLKQSCRFSCT